MWKVILAQPKGTSQPVLQQNLHNSHLFICLNRQVGVCGLAILKSATMLDRYFALLISFNHCAEVCLPQLASVAICWKNEKCQPQSIECLTILICFKTSAWNWILVDLPVTDPCVLALLSVYCVCLMWFLSDIPKYSCIRREMCFCSILFVCVWWVMVCVCVCMCLCVSMCLCVGDGV